MFMRPGALSITILILAFGLLAQEGNATEDGNDKSPAPITRQSYFNGGYIKIGDLSIASEEEVASLESNALGGPVERERCVNMGPAWIERSQDGLGLELRKPWSFRDARILAARCDGVSILVGGSIRRGEGEDTTTAPVFFYWEDGRGPVSFSPDPSVSVGRWPKVTNYSVLEVRAIDSESQRMLFTGVGKEGDIVHLLATYVITPKRDRPSD